MCQDIYQLFSNPPFLPPSLPGCAVGGSTFALARTYEHVDGLELSAAFVKVSPSLLPFLP